MVVAAAAASTFDIGLLYLYPAELRKFKQHTTLSLSLFVCRQGLTHILAHSHCWLLLLFTTHKQPQPPLPWVGESFLTRAAICLLPFLIFCYGHETLSLCPHGREMKNPTVSSSRVRANPCPYHPVTRQKYDRPCSNFGTASNL